MSGIALFVGAVAPELGAILKEEARPAMVDALKFISTRATPSPTKPSPAKCWTTLAVGCSMLASTSVCAGF
jgi:hypothetical protein